MAGCYAPLRRRILHKCLPFLFKKCPDGNNHYRWDRLCFCRENEHCAGEWNGGIFDFKTGQELFRLEDSKYAPLEPDYGEPVECMSNDSNYDDLQRSFDEFYKSHPFPKRA